MRYFQSGVLVVACAISMNFSPVAHADPVAVPNFSFEDPAQNNPDGYSHGGLGDTTAIPGWTVTAAGDQYNGVFQPKNEFTPPDGVQVAYQDLPSLDSASIDTTDPVTTVIPGDIYTLTVAVGNRTDQDRAAGDYTIELLADGNVVASSSLPGSTITPGTFTDLSTVYIAPPTVPPNAPQLTIRLMATNTTTAFHQGDYDNVRLDATAIPEPAGLTLLGLGGLGLLLRRRRHVMSSRS